VSDLERSGLASMRDCWITGGAAFDFAPAEWKAIAQDPLPDERERRLLAIAGQALDVAMRPAAPKGLTRRPPLPRLALPTLPDRLRPLFRTVLKQASNIRRMRAVTLVASRRFIAHPLDWMPAASDQDCPDVYAPWIDWRANAAPAKDTARDALTAENWDDVYPAARRAALTEMRAADPFAARILIATKAQGEAAEVRLPLIELLHVGLNADDVPFLKSLSGDRSGKVRELALRLLARLGEHGLAASGEAANPVAELAGFITEGKSGFIRRRTVFAPVTVKSSAQERRRAELFESCSLIDLAGRFGVAEAALLDGWQYGSDRTVDGLLAGMVSTSGSDTAVAHMADGLLSDAAAWAPLLIRLSSRLDRQRMRTFAIKLLGGDLPSLNVLDAAEAVEPGRIGRDDILRSRSFKALRSALAGTNEMERRVAANVLETLGFLATAAAADSVIGEVVAAGLAPADAALGLLRLNAALGERGENTGL